MTSPKFEFSLNVADCEADLRQAVASISRYLQLAHQIRGRVRFKVQASIIDHPAASRFVGEQLSAALGAVRGVHAIRVNKLARSCTVEYDPTVIPDAAWADFLGGRQSLAAKILFSILEEKIAEVRHGQF
jgi:hypothetical protein